MSARLFQVVREADITGVSGTGVVADGVEFPDAASRVALDHYVNYDLLRAAYDEHCTQPHQEN